MYVHSFVHVQSVEKFGTRKKRKENMRKAIDVETKREKTHFNTHTDASRSRQDLSDEYYLTKLGVDTAKHGPFKV